MPSFLGSGCIPRLGLAKTGEEAEVVVVAARGASPFAVWVTFLLEPTLPNNLIHRLKAIGLFLLYGLTCPFYIPEGLS